MNEQIKALMLEAGYAAPEIAGRAHKLVDLLLADILDSIDSVDESELEGGDFEDIMFLVSKHIKKRFGAT